MKYIRLPAWRMRRKNVRTDYGSDEDLRALALSRIEHQVNPLILEPPDKEGFYAIVDGNRTHRGTELVGRTDAEFDAIVTDKPLTEELRIRAQLISSIHRAGVKPFDTAVGIRRLMEIEGISRKEAAERLRMDASNVTVLLSVFDCSIEIQEDAKSGKIGPAAWYRAAKEAKEGRQDRKPRASSIKLQLPKGTTVTFGNDSLESVIESFKQALKVMEDAQADKLDLAAAVKQFTETAKAR